MLSFFFLSVSNYFVTRKPRKLLTAPVSDDDDDRSSPNWQTAPPAPDPSQSGESKKKKKEKNKFKTEGTTPELGRSETKQQETVETATESIETGTKKKKKKKERNKFKVQHDEISSTTTSGEEELVNYVKTHPQRTYLLMKPGDAWMDDQVSFGLPDPGIVPVIGQDNLAIIFFFT